MYVHCISSSSEVSVSIVKCEDFLHKMFCTCLHDNLEKNRRFSPRLLAMSHGHHTVPTTQYRACITMFQFFRWMIKKSLLFTGTYSAHGRGNYNTVSYFNQSVIRPYVKAGYVSDIIALKITQISYSAYLQNINNTYVKNIFNLCLTHRFLLLVSSWFVLRFPLLPSEGEPLKQCVAAWNAQITPASNCY